MAQRTISWTNPTKYTDASVLTPADIAAIKIHVYKDGTDTYTTLPGVTTFPIQVNPGITNVWELSSELHGVQSVKSSPLSYTEPFLATMAPTALSIT